MTLTQARLKELLHYDPATGAWTWLVDPLRGPRRAGKPAGSDKGGGYKRIVIGGARHYAHRLAVLYMTGEWPDGDVDHKDRDPSDNRWSELRVSSHSQNLANAKRPKNNTSGHKGVTWHRRIKRWHVRVGRRHVGYFKEKEAAVTAYSSKATEIYGEFARVG